MEKKVLVGCFIVGTLVTIVIMLLKEQIPVLMYDKLNGLSLGVMFPLAIDSSISLFKRVFGRNKKEL